MITGQGHGRKPEPELDPRNAMIQGAKGMVSLEYLSEQEKKRLYQKLKESERQIQLYNTKPRNRAERRARARAKRKA